MPPAAAVEEGAQYADDDDQSESRSEPRPADMPAAVEQDQDKRHRDTPAGPSRRAAPVRLERETQRIAAAANIQTGAGGLTRADSLLTSTAASAMAPSQRNDQGEAGRLGHVLLLGGSMKRGPIADQPSRHTDAHIIRARAAPRTRVGRVLRIRSLPTLVAPNQQCSQAEADQERGTMHVAHRGKHNTNQQPHDRPDPEPRQPRAASATTTTHTPRQAGPRRPPRLPASLVWGSHNRTERLADHAAAEVDRNNQLRCPKRRSASTPTAVISTSTTMIIQAASYCTEQCGE